MAHVTDKGKLGRHGHLVRPGEVHVHVAELGHVGLPARVGGHHAASAVEKTKTVAVLNCDSLRAVQWHVPCDSLVTCDYRLPNQLVLPVD